MLKFQNNTTIVANFEDFIFITYVIIDELHHHFIPSEVTKHRHVWNVKLSYVEIITIALYGKLIDGKLIQDVEEQNICHFALKHSNGKGN